MAKLLVPSTLLSHVEEKKIIEVSGNQTVEKMLHHLVNLYPTLQSILFNNDGKLKSHIMICINNNDIRLTDGIDSIIGENDTVSIILALAGG